MPEPRLEDFDWRSLLRVNHDELMDWFEERDIKSPRAGLDVRFYTIKSQENKPNYEGLVSYILSCIPHYVFDQQNIDELSEDGHDPLTVAIKFFGNSDPIRDGKYGELILYLLVEGILEIPMVVHKLGQSYSDNVQVKGSDGLFVGRFKGEMALMIGESKMRNQWSVCLSDAVSSLERYINHTDNVERELLVAKNNLSRDIQTMSQEALDLLYNAFRPSREEYRQLTLRHPVLLVYKEKAISDLIADSHDGLEAKLIELVINKAQDKANSVNNSTSGHGDSKFDFFLIPVSCVNELRELCYKVFHNGQIYVRD